MDSTVPIPEPSPPTFAMTAGNYYVYDNTTNEFSAHKFKLGELTGKFLRIDVSPKVLKPGYISYKKQVLLVSMNELLRRRINVERNASIRTGAAQPAQSTVNVVQQPITGVADQQTIEQDLGAHIDEAADILWAEQIGALYGIENSEEDWESVAYTPQPRPNHAESTVQNPEQTPE
jgi:hypothetical protein